MSQCQNAWNSDTLNNEIIFNRLQFPHNKNRQNQSNKEDNEDDLTLLQQLEDQFTLCKCEKHEDDFKLFSEYNINQEIQLDPIRHENLINTRRSFPLDAENIHENYHKSLKQLSKAEASPNLLKYALPLAVFENKNLNELKVIIHSRVRKQSF